MTSNNAVLIRVFLHSGTSGASHLACTIVVTVESTRRMLRKNPIMTGWRPRGYFLAEQDCHSWYRGCWVSDRPFRDDETCVLAVALARSIVSFELGHGMRRYPPWEDTQRRHTAGKLKVGERAERFSRTKTKPAIPEKTIRPLILKREARAVYWRRLGRTHHEHSRPLQHSRNPKRVNGPHSANRTNGSKSNQSTTGPSDQLDISSAGAAAAKAVEGGEIRADLVARVRSEIASGTYETTEKLDGALDGLLNELG